MLNEMVERVALEDSIVDIQRHNVKEISQA